MQAVLSQLARVERERDALAAANERLRDENVRLRAMDVAFRELLNFADERSHGQLRILVEQAGEQLADWLSAALE
jgi:NADP-dependent 3-hydroxy acid dehydrogenase YdfG